VELNNLVKALKGAANDNDPAGNKIFFFTDSSTTAEHAFYKGTLQL
jgi:hypothetical protein